MWATEFHPPTGKSRQPTANHDSSSTASTKLGNAARIARMPGVQCPARDPVMRGRTMTKASRTLVTVAAIVNAMVMPRPSVAAASASRPVTQEVPKSPRTAPPNHWDSDSHGLVGRSYSLRMASISSGVASRSRSRARSTA